MSEHSNAVRLSMIRASMAAHGVGPGKRAALFGQLVEILEPKDVALDFVSWWTRPIDRDGKPIAGARRRAAKDHWFSAIYADDAQLPDLSAERAVVEPNEADFDVARTLGMEHEMRSARRRLSSEEVWQKVMVGAALTREVRESGHLERLYTEYLGKQS